MIFVIYKRLNAIFNAGVRMCEVISLLSMLRSANLSQFIQLHPHFLLKIFTLVFIFVSLILQLMIDYLGSSV